MKSVETVQVGELTIGLIEDQIEDGICLHYIDISVERNKTKVGMFSRPMARECAELFIAVFAGLPGAKRKE